MKPPTPEPTPPPPEKPETPMETPKEITPETEKAQKTTDDFIRKMMDVMTHSKCYMTRPLPRPALNWGSMEHVAGLCEGTAFI